MEQTCLIVGAGSFDLCNFIKTKDNYIIAADGGYSHLKKLKIEPDLILGDFDSLGYVPSHPNISQHKPEKDDTDMMLAVETAIEKGFKKIYIYGGLGGRLDHSLANIHTLSFAANNNTKAYLIGEGVVVTILKEDKIRFSKDCKGYISAFSHTELSEGINICGLKYELDNANLCSSSTLGVSNEFLGKEAYISVKKGSLILIWQREINSNQDSLGILE